MQHQLANFYFRYHKIGLIPGQPLGNSDSKNPGTWVESRFKAPRVFRGGGCWCLELAHAQLLQKSTYTKLSDEQNVQVTAVVCNLIVHHGFLPVSFMGPKNFRHLRSTEHLYLRRWWNLPILQNLSFQFDYPTDADSALIFPINC